MIYEFTPTQDLHGYEQPWAPGAGVNIWDEEWEQGDFNNNTGANYPSTTKCRSVNYIPIDPTASYYFNSPADVSAYMFFYDEDKAYIGFYGTNIATSRTFVPEDLSNSLPGGASFSNAAYIRFRYDAASVPSGSLSINYPSTVTTYSPYANICPISGYNIWDPSNADMVQVYSGYVDAEARKLYLHPVYEEYDGEELVGPWMSSMDKYTEEGTPTTGAFVVDMGGELIEVDLTDFMLQTLLDSLGVRRFFASGAMLLNSLMDQAQGRVRSEEELLNRSLPLHVIAIGEDLPTNLVIKKPISDVLPGLPGKIKKI